MSNTLLRIFALPLLCCLTVVAGAAPADTDKNGNLIGLTTANGKLAYDFIDLWFNKHQPEQAWDKYVSRDNYMNHAVYSAVAGEHKTYEEEKAGEAKATSPTMRFNFEQIVAQGDLVFMHIQAFDGQNSYGDEMIIILRIKDAKVVDAWDLAVPLKKNSAVFVGLDR